MLREAQARLREATRVAVLTGAGVSAPSGIPTFRDPGGLWKDFRIEDYATPEAYARDPERVWAWYAWRYQKVWEARPNRAHELLARLEVEKGNGFLLVTQNIDGLHQRAGSRQVVELHGNIARARCEWCDTRVALPPPEAFTPPPTCPRCTSRMRPDVVWFGELLPEAAFAAAERAFAGAEVALIIGTSAVVEPAASLGRHARWNGAYVIEINPEATPLTLLAHCALRMGAVEGLEALLAPPAEDHSEGDLPKP